MTVCLAVLAMSGALGCADTPVQVPASEVSAAVAGTDSVALTYICGNMFRIRNSSFEPRSVRWDIYNAAPADTGSLWARGRDVGRTSVDFFVTARTKGTMRLFVGTTLIATKANGSSAACGAPVDATPFPVLPVLAEPRTDIVTSSPIILAPDSVYYRRTLVNVRFKVGASDALRRAFQSRYGAQLINRYPTVFQFRLPDLGTSYAAFAARISAIAADSVILKAKPHRAFDAVVTFGARYPSDAASHRRTDYINGANSVWPALALRLPQAWWCENGLYGGTTPTIAMYEQNFPLLPATDVSKSLRVPVVRVTRWRDTMQTQITTIAADSTLFVNHGHAIASIVASSGDDGVGLAGPLWRANLRIFTPGNINHSVSAGADIFYYAISDEIQKAAPRILSLSSDIRAPADTEHREMEFYGITNRLKRLMDSLPNLLIIQAIGNDSVTTSYSSRDSTKRYVFQEALVSLRDSSPSYRDRIIFVGETNRNGNRDAESNAYPGLVDIYAPGVDVPGLLPDGTVARFFGTSFAAPLVAGIAGQIIAMDSTLSAADVKRLLLAGARDNVENSNGDDVAPSRVGNTSDVVYEADAFGSLRILSGTKPGTPICDPSFAYWKLAAAQPTGPKGWRAVRYGGTLDDRFDQPGMPGRESGYSLAPGGRLLATSAGLQAVRAGGVRLRRLIAGGWSDSTTVGTWDLMQFGEKDVLYARGVGGVADTVPDVEYLISGTGRPTVPRRAFNNTAQRVVRIVMRPDGDGVAVVAERNQELFLTLVDAGGNSSTAVSLGSASALPQIVHSDVYWRPDSKGLVVTSSARNTPVTTSHSWGTNVKYFEVNGSGAPTFKANVPTGRPVGQVVTGRWGAGGARFDIVSFIELDVSECNLSTSRASASPAGIFSAEVDHNEYCGENKLTAPNPGGGGCSDLCENACCFGIFKINKRNFPIARIRADSQARRVNY